MPRNESALKHPLRCGILFAFCLAVLFQTGCAQRRTLTWETLGELHIVDNKETTYSTSNERRAEIIPPAIWRAVLLVEPNGTTYLRLLCDNEGEYRFLYLQNKDWQFTTDWPEESLRRRDEQGVKEQDSFSEIETHLWKENLADALYESLLPSIKFPEFLQKSDVLYGELSESAREVERADLRSSEAKPWNDLNGIEKKEYFLEWLHYFCREVTDIDRNDIDWEKGDHQDVALLTGDNWAEWYTESLFWPGKMRRSLETQDGSPEVFFRKRILGRDVVVLHTFKHRFIFNDDERGPYLFKNIGDALILCHENSLWLLSPDCQKIRHYEIPIRLPDAGTYGAFFLKDRTLYVFGQSSTDPKKAVVLKTNLDDILSTEKADSPKP